MSEIQSAAAGRGHVRAVFSRRCNGHAAPLDLIRVHLRACRIAWGRAIFYKARDAERARVAAGFADYLVTDSDDEALRALERAAKYAKKYVEKVPAFSDRRAEYEGKIDGLCLTGGDSTRPDGSLDSPDCISAGFAKRFCSSDGCDLAAPAFVFRDGWLW